MQGNFEKVVFGQDPLEPVAILIEIFSIIEFERKNLNALYLMSEKCIECLKIWKICKSVFERFSICI